MKTIVAELAKNASLFKWILLIASLLVFIFKSLVYHQHYATRYRKTAFRWMFWFNRHDRYASFSESERAFMIGCNFLSALFFCLFFAGLLFYVLDVAV